MLAAGPLMIEHRVIERMIKILERAADAAGGSRGFLPGLIETALDFLGNYADRCHHGKEEGILFAELDKKPLKAQHRKLLGELLNEHEEARKLTASLALLAMQAKPGDAAAVTAMQSKIRELVSLYKTHIEKEDKRFFIPVMEYFSSKAQSRLLESFCGFDSGLVHEQYSKVLERFE